MKTLFIEPTDTTPKIIFDAENLNFEISGHSRPEDVRTFYRPVLAWLKDFLTALINKEVTINKKIEIDFKMVYFNSSSAKFLLDVLVEINKIHQMGYETQINWYYDDGDDDMKEVGKDLSEMVEFPFTYVVK